MVQDRSGKEMELVIGKAVEMGQQLMREEQN
jgi:hypothetical protein